MDFLARVVKSSLFFAFLGPPVGTLVMFAMDFARRPRWELFGAVLPMMLLSYFAAAIPAAATGMVAGALQPWLSSWRHYVAVGVAGAVITLAFALLVAHQPLLRPLEFVLLCVIPSALAGTTCARLCYGPPNNSSKPTPRRGAA